MNLFQDMLFKKVFHFAAGEVRSALQYLEELEEEKFGLLPASSIINFMLS